MTLDKAREQQIKKRPPQHHYKTTDEKNKRWRLTGSEERGREVQTHFLTHTSYFSCLNHHHSQAQHHHQVTRPSLAPLPPFPSLQPQQPSHSLYLSMYEQLSPVFKVFNSQVRSRGVSVPVRVAQEGNRCCNSRQ